MIRTLNLNRKTTAVLENAYGIGYEKEVNAIWQASFSLPINDPKVEKVELLQYVEIDDIGLFVINPKNTKKSSNSVTFDCEHVLSTLLYGSLFKYHQLTNYETKDVIDYLLDQQHHKHWKRGKVDFSRGFHYSWENENILSALFSVPKPFDEQYQWKFDTSSYPWELSLVEPDTEPICRIKEGYNLVDFEIEEDPKGVYNRIYPIGDGEGVNQLTIESVNEGKPYIDIRESHDEEIRETIWVDKRFKNVQALYDNALAKLKEWKTPKVTWKVSAADVSSITGLSIDKFQLGKVVRLQLDDYPTTDLRIMKESKKDIYGNPGDVQLEIGNVQEDLGTTNADLERRQKINELYAQGATNILNFGYQDNCDSNIPAVIPFYVDDDVVNINTIELTYRTKAFRAYSQATKGGGAVVKSTKSGGGKTKTTTSGGSTTATSSSGGGTSKSTKSGGGSSQTSSSGGGGTRTSNHYCGDVEACEIAVSEQVGEGKAHFHQLPAQLQNHTHDVEIPSHTHSVSIPSHSHSFSTPNHKHDVEIPSHTHKVDIPSHTHEIELPDHTHDVKHEIIELDEKPDKVTIKVDGNTVDHDSTKGDRIDLAEYMGKDDSGKIERGRHEVEILPDGLARIEADLILRVFIQSQLGEVH